MKPNTVMGIAEPAFRELWIAKLWEAMAKTGRGYKRHSLRHTGRNNADGTPDRRADKIGTTKLERRLMQRVSVA